MVKHVGTSVAMGNAVPQVKAAAAVVVSSNDDGGIVEAFERFVL
jgi:hydroxymethylpyrimidine pyrophosphatase-like HAD family hydrolase